ncbi:hypothetical protein BDB00DRAFT_757786, partial [Zychaea mexicana]|uniref:uncharacterized protein n=1 Tax=Zychaea mexicana TaxID=64656 RepID=UPI0022FE1C52
IIDLMRKLPPVPIAEDTNEFELSTRYVDHLFTGLFDDPDEDILPKTSRYVYKSFTWDDLHMASNHGYGEAKSAAQDGNNHSICRDLFCKNALDAQNMKGVLGLQILGRMVTFHVLILPSTGLYVMCKLVKMKISSCLDDLNLLWICLTFPAKPTFP